MSCEFFNMLGTSIVVVFVAVSVYTRYALHRTGRHSIKRCKTKRCTGRIT